VVEHFRYADFYIGPNTIYKGKTFSHKLQLLSGTGYCQPSVMFNLRLDCVVLDNIQQSICEQIVIKTLSLYMD